MMNEMTEGVEVKVTGIFPVPIYQTTLNRELTTEEISFCNIQSKCLLVKKECATENRNINMAI